MRVRLLLAAVASAAVAVPIGAAEACTYTYVPATGIGVLACSEGLRPVPGGWSTASKVGVDVNGGKTEFCIARTTVTTSGVEHDPRTIYPC